MRVDACSDLNCFMEFPPCGLIRGGQSGPHIGGNSGAGESGYHFSHDAL